MLDGEHSLWRAVERMVALVAPHIDETCVGVPLTAGFNVDIVTRTIVRRAHNSLAAIATAVASTSRASARVHLRAMAEDFIFLKWLLGLDEAVATEYVQRSARLEGLRAVRAQMKFLPGAYRQLGADVPALGFADVTEALERVQDELADLCEALGWGKHGPSVRRMAEAADLLTQYEFFYFLSSKAVHANLHEMARIVWGSEQSVDISAEPFEGIHADLAVVYGVWLFDETLDVAMDRLVPLQQLLRSEAYSVWLTLILVGPARNGRLPLLIHPEEFRWR